MKGPVYIVCGGTGGHLAPGIATAQRFIEARIPVELVVSEKEVDSRLLQSYPDMPFRRAKGSPFGWQPAALARFIYNTIAGGIQSFNLMRNEQPAAVIAFGGFLSFSFVVTAWLLRIPVVLHEANRKAGKSIRTLVGMADRVYLPEGVHLTGIEPNRIRRAGMPLRREVHHLMKDEIRRRLGIPFHVKVLAVVGGSQGALALNQWVEQQLEALAAEGIWVFLVSGPGKQVLPELQVLRSKTGAEVEVRTFAFHSALHELFSAADLCISRAGAGTIAELVACLAPSILIPFPYAADQHQLANARDLEQRGGGIVVEQSRMDSLYSEVQDLIFNDWLLARMRHNLRSLNHEDVAADICQFVREKYINDAPSGGMVKEEPVGNA